MPDQLEWWHVVVLLLLMVFGGGGLVDYIDARLRRRFNLTPRAAPATRAR